MFYEKPYDTIENLKKKSERKERSFRENRKKGIIFRSNAINKEGAKTFRCLATFLCEDHVFFFFSALMPYNKSFIDQGTSVKMAGYWPRSLFAFLWTSTSSRSMKTQKENEANIQPS